MIQRLGGKRWRFIHQTIYLIAILAEIHFLLQSKNDVYQPMLMLGLLAWLFGWRLLHKWRGSVSHALARRRSRSQRRSTMAWSRPHGTRS